MKTVLVLLFIALLAGCASFDRARSAVAVSGAQAADSARESAEWALCNGISIGAWRRAYGGDAARADGWKALCAAREGTPQ